jgi:thioredoxin-like negative regulator of GroEL
MRSGEWQKLHNLIGTVKWGEMEFMRKAFLTAALDHIGEEGEAAREWKDAVAAVRTRSDGLERLARFAVQAKWAGHAEEIMRTLATLPQCPRWVMDSLWKDAFQRSDTTQLQKLSGAIAKSDPKGIAARNNYAFLSLLTRNAEGNPHRIAETLHREHPENALVTSTYALSLYQQGKAADAAALMSTLNPEALREPQVALHQAIFLLAIGQAEKADEFLALSAKWQMLPEEKTLLERAKVAGAKAGGSAGDPQKSAPTDRPR